MDDFKIRYGVEEVLYISQLKDWPNDNLAAESSADMDGRDEQEGHSMKALANIITHLT